MEGGWNEELQTSVADENYSNQGSFTDAHSAVSKFIS